MSTYTKAQGPGETWLTRDYGHECHARPVLHTSAMPAQPARVLIVATYAKCKCKVQSKDWQISKRANRKMCTKGGGEWGYL